jgi:hypothetical protein
VQIVIKIFRNLRGGDDSGEQNQRTRQHTENCMRSLQGSLL